MLQASHASICKGTSSLSRVETVAEDGRSRETGEWKVTSGRLWQGSGIFDAMIGGISMSAYYETRTLKMGA